MDDKLMVWLLTLALDSSLPELHKDERGWVMEAPLLFLTNESFVSQLLI